MWDVPNLTQQEVFTVMRCPPVVERFRDFSIIFTENPSEPSISRTCGGGGGALVDGGDLVGGAPFFLLLLLFLLRPLLLLLLFVVFVLKMEESISS